MKPAVRISIGIVALTTSLLLVGDSLLGIFPDPNASELEARQDLSESLAVQYTALVTANQLPQMRTSMEALVAQMPEVLSMSLRKSDGTELGKTTDHASLWTRTEDTRSTPTHVQIPIFDGPDRWGTLEVRFENLPSMGLAGLFHNPLYKLIAIMGATGFFAYLFYLSRTLRYLDPSAVVPDRVRAALDQLVEGVFILDHEQSIVLANSAFARNFDREPDALMGINPSTFDWLVHNGDGGQSELPWSASMGDGARRTDIRLELNSLSGGVRVFSCNVSPISDEKGKMRGVLTSLDDISELERMNEGLQQALMKLEIAHVEVENKNEELAVLATTDSLTGCLNRRAFNEKIKMEFKLAKRDNLELSVVMADIDHFKSVNDIFGHSTGDAVIRDMAESLKNCLRVNDCVGRYGGEEFCILLVSTSASEAEQISERARTAFEDCSEHEGSATGGRKVTASFGISTISNGAADATELIDQADKALYHSKNFGRNRVTNWTEIREEEKAVS